VKSACCPTGRELPVDRSVNAQYSLDNEVLEIMGHDGIVARRRIHLHIRHTFHSNPDGITTFARANKRD